LTQGKCTAERGRIAEDIACDYLNNQFGLALLDRNYRTPHGEIDLIMKDGDTTVFIEVRSRTRQSFMETLETIDRNKCMRIIQSSEYYLQRQVSNYNEVKCRFDVVTLNGPLETARLEWIKDAFEA
jgi:putative endonuclease